MIDLIIVIDLFEIFFIEIITLKKSVEMNFRIDFKR